MMESCREKIVSEKYADFLWKSSWSPNGLESFFPEVCFQMINDYYDVYYVSLPIWILPVCKDDIYNIKVKLFGKSL